MGPSPLILNKDENVSIEEEIAECGTNAGDSGEMSSFRCALNHP